MNIARHLSVLLLVFIVYSFNAFIVYGEGVRVNLSFPRPPSDPNPLAWIWFIGSSISWAFSAVIDIIRVLVTGMTFALFPYPLNYLLSIVFGVLLFYGMYPIIVFVIKLVIEAIKGLGSVKPFTAILLVLALSLTIQPVIASNNIVVDRIVDSSGDRLVVNITFPYNVDKIGYRVQGDDVVKWVAYNTSSTTIVLRNYGVYDIVYVVNGSMYFHEIDFDPWYIDVINRDYSMIIATIVLGLASLLSPLIGVAGYSTLIVFMLDTITIFDDAYLKMAYIILCLVLYTIYFYTIVRIRGKIF